MKNVNNYANNGGGSSTMKKKYGSKFNSAAGRGVSSGKSFSINGVGKHNYIGNPNSNFSQDPFSSNKNACLNINDKTIKTSVKNTKGLLQTRIVSNQTIKANPVNSFFCYQKVNYKLKEKYDHDISDLDLSNCDALNKAGFNKHFRSENKDASSKIERSKCVVDRSNYREELETEIQKNKNKTCDYKKVCNITKDLTAVNSYVVGYDVYMLKKKKCCNYNPPDAKVIAC